MFLLYKFKHIALKFLWLSQIESDCSLKTKEGRDNEILFQADIAVDDSNLVLEQNIIKYGPDEILNLGGIYSPVLINGEKKKKK